MGMGESDYSVLEPGADIPESHEILEISVIGVFILHKLGSNTKEDGLVAKSRLSIYQNSTERTVVISSPDFH